MLKKQGINVHYELRLYTGWWATGEGDFGVASQGCWQDIRTGGSITENSCFHYLTAASSEKTCGVKENLLSEKLAGKNPKTQLGYKRDDGNCEQLLGLRVLLPPTGAALAGG